MKMRLFYILAILLCCTAEGAQQHYISRVLQSSETVEALSRSPNKNGYWKKPPEVYICKNAPITEQRIGKALEFWKNLGYEFGDVFYHDESFGCINENFGFGGITIDLIGQKFKEPNIGMTWNWKHTKTGEIVKSRIEIKHGWGDSPRVLEHEIGHSLGWLDYGQYGHLMNHDWSKGGLDTKGLKNVYEK
tara:strand:+ start:12222 stop:12791 length:570 start_codon:yes stop_codon:yes gene_type:complete